MSEVQLRRRVVRGFPRGEAPDSAESERVCALQEPGAGGEEAAGGAGGGKVAGGARGEEVAGGAGGWRIVNASARRCGGHSER